MFRIQDVSKMLGQTSIVSCLHQNKESNSYTLVGKSLIF